MALTPKLASDAGMSRSELYRAVRDGKLERIARGIYVSAEDRFADWDLMEVAIRRPDGIICLKSALAYHDLTDEIPAAIDVAIPRGARRPAGSKRYAWHSFERETFDIGRESKTIDDTDMTIGIYSPERTIVDCYRLRGQVTYEMPRDALKEWLRRGGKPSALMRIASQLPRAKGPILNALDILS